MKKSLAFFLTGSMILSLAACSSEVTDTTTDTVSTAETLVEETTTEATTKEETKETEATEGTTTEATFVEPIYLPVIEGPDTIEQFEDYNLVWYDDFNDGEVITDNWVEYLVKPYTNNNELQEYTQSEENIFIKDNKLVIKAIKTQTDTGKDYYTSGKVSTYKKMDIMYGKIVVSAKVPEGQGLWPAIWMMPTSEKYGSWPRGGEIDIMEILCQEPNKTYSTIHYGNPHEQQQGFYVLPEGSFADDFHEYILEWEPDSMKFYIDDVLVASFDDWFTGMSADKARPFPAPFNQQFYLQLNLAVGGDWPGSPDETTDFDNAEFQIDYVHVYQKSEYNTEVYKPGTAPTGDVEVREPDSDGNYVINGDYSKEDKLDGSAKWQFMPMEGGEGSAAIVDGVVEITTTNDGNVDYSIQFVQADLPLINGKSYTLTFDAWSDEDRSMKAGISGPDHAYVRYLEDQEIKLTTSKTTYEFTFTMEANTDKNSRIEFNMGATGSTAKIYIDNVSLKENK